MKNEVPHPRQRTSIPTEITWPGTTGMARRQRHGGHMLSWRGIGLRGVSVQDDITKGLEIALWPFAVDTSDCPLSLRDDRNQGGTERGGQMPIISANVRKSALLGGR
jgi:hypothetical protein